MGGGGVAKPRHPEDRTNPHHQGGEGGPAPATTRVVATEVTIPRWLGFTFTHPSNRSPLPPFLTPQSAAGRSAG